MTNMVDQIAEVYLDAARRTDEERPGGVSARDQRAQVIAAGAKNAFGREMSADEISAMLYGAYVLSMFEEEYARSAERNAFGRLFGYQLGRREALAALATLYGLRH